MKVKVSYLRERKETEKIKTKIANVGLDVDCCTRDNDHIVGNVEAVIDAVCGNGSNDIEVVILILATAMTMTDVLLMMSMIKRNSVTHFFLIQQFQLWQLPEMGISEF